MDNVVFNTDVSQSNELMEILHGMDKAHGSQGPIISVALPTTALEDLKRLANRMTIFPDGAKLVKITEFCGVPVEEWRFLPQGFIATEHRESWVIHFSGGKRTILPKIKVRDLTGLAQTS